MLRMYHFKHQDGSISFIGWDDQRKIFSRDYYANVGICNAEESKHVKYSEVKRLVQSCIDLGFKEVSYLKQDPEEKKFLYYDREKEEF